MNRMVLKISKNQALSIKI